jgi:hypothetical protein
VIVKLQALAFNSVGDKKMPTWKELEAEFREMQETLRFSRLETHWGSSGEYWRLAGSLDSNAKKRFEALAYIAGEKLNETLERSAEGYQEVLSESDPARRWYKGIWKISGNFEYAFPAQELDENGKVVGHIFTGSINRPAEASSVFCLELAALFRAGTQGFQKNRCYKLAIIYPYLSQKVRESNNHWSNSHSILLLFSSDLFLGESRCDANLDSVGKRL